MTVPVVADRPVRASVALVDGFGEPACTVAGEPTTATAEAFAERHDVTFSGVCPGIRVIPIVELTDEAGETSRWSLLAGEPSVGAAEQWFDGLVFTEHIQWAVGRTIEIDYPSAAGRIRVADFDVDGSEFDVDLYESDSKFRINTSGRGCMVFGTGGDQVTGIGQSGIIYSGLTVDVELRVEVELLVPGCSPAPGFTQPGPIVHTQTLTYEEAASDEPIVWEFAVPVPGVGGPDETLEVTATLWLGFGR